MHTKEYEVFSPGRVCLFGEHSDWAGAYRRFNSEIVAGEVIITGTNQGIFARVRRSPGVFTIKSTLDDGSVESWSVPMVADFLLAEAEKGEFFSYAAGVAYYMLTFYSVDGLTIDNYKTTLPVKKGLSSSAAFCVLVARAFDCAYDLRMTVRAEMEAAYQGEILTPSRCGRMDQGCAYGQVPVQMTFDGDLLRTRELRVGKEIHLLVGDLKGEKDTIRILADLNQSYPFVKTEADRKVQGFLGKISREIVLRAAEILRRGDAAALGALMTEAQAEFDRHLMPVCDEFRAPRLHQVLADEQVCALTYGGKGVGSQGDGTVQFVARSPEMRSQLADYLCRTYGMDCFELDISPPKAVRKAVIPVAGLGAEMFPATKLVRRELFPVIDAAGVSKPILLTVVEEALAAGIERVALVIRPDERQVFEKFFNRPADPEVVAKVPAAAKAYLSRLREIGECIEFVEQKEALGFGDAVLQARAWTEGEPVLLLLADHLYLSRHGDAPCARQLVEACNEHRDCCALALFETEFENVVNHGVVTGEWLDDSRTVLALSRFTEKPSVDYAKKHFTVPALGKGKSLCVFGQYVLNAAFFEQLQELADADNETELSLTAALQAVRRQQPVLGLVVDGEQYDAGVPEDYVNSLIAYREKV